jgi:LmbE family N-acetylglucosaminyl deacetylase
MGELEYWIELIGHLMTVLALISVAAYVLLRRRALRRTVRRAPFVYWLALVTSLALTVVNLAHLIRMIGSPAAAHASPWLDLVAEYVTLVVQSLTVLLLIAWKVMPELHTGRRCILAVGAHPDDIELACGATLAKLHDAGHRIRGLVLTHGEQGGSAETRPNEARSGASFLGLESVQVMDFQDTRLGEQELEVLAAIEGAIRECKPDLIFTHSSHDLHQDHQAVHRATLRAARNHSSILCYESPSATGEFDPTFFVDVSDYIEVKIESVKEHWDQRGKPYVHSERMHGVALFRGSQAKTRYAEGFETVRILSSALGEV